jgi:subtilisin family serine protease
VGEREPQELAAIGTVHSAVWAEEQQYLVAGHKNALPNPVAITAAGGTWSGQVPSIGVAIVTSRNPDFLTRVREDRSVDLAGPDVEAQIPEEDLTSPAALTTAEAVLSASEDQAVASGTTPKDPLYVLQWPHRVMDILRVQNLGITGKGVRIFVVGTGIAPHPDLKPTLKDISFVPLPPRSCAQDTDCPLLPDREGTLTESTCDLARFICNLSDGSTGYEAATDIGPSTHEMSVAGIIAAQCNTIGVCGIAPGVDSINVKIYSKSDPTRQAAPLSRILQALEWVADEGARLYRGKILNFSGSIACQQADQNCRDKLIHSLGIANRMVEHLYKNGVVIIASAGNEGRDVLDEGFFHWPAKDSPHTIAVSGTGGCDLAFDGNVLNDGFYDYFMSYNFGFDPNDSRYLVAPAGPLSLTIAAASGCVYPKPKCKVGNLLTLDCYLYDQVVTTTRRDLGANGYTFFSGTSAAAPQVTGVAALWLSREISQGRDPSPGQLTEAILFELTVDLGDPGYDPLFGYGRVSAASIE